MAVVTMAPFVLERVLVQKHNWPSHVGRGNRLIVLLLL
jgi:hypothetical protein